MRSFFSFDPSRDLGRVLAVVGFAVIGAGCDAAPRITPEPRLEHKERAGQQREGWTPPDSRAVSLLKTTELRFHELLRDKRGKKKAVPNSLEQRLVQPSKQARPSEVSRKKRHLPRVKQKRSLKRGDVSHRLRSEPRRERRRVTVRHAAPKNGDVRASTDTDKERLPSIAVAPLRVKRLVVTNKIANREPVSADRLIADGSPLIAFVEVENTRDRPVEIEVVFRHSSGREVGFVTLEIPAARRRWRTWARTRRITNAGEWTVELRSVKGAVLKSAAFSAFAVK